MKRLLTPIFILGFFGLQIIFQQNNCYSQSVDRYSLVKRNLNLEDIKSWSNLGNFPILTKNGSYFMYEFLNQPVGSSTLVVRSTRGNWETKIPGIRIGFGNVQFSGDNKQLIYQVKDSLFFLTLGSSSVDRVITGVDNIFFPKAGNWFIYRSKVVKDQVTIYYFETKKELVLQNISDFWFDKNGSSLLVKAVIDTSGSITRSLRYIDIQSGKMNSIWADTLDCGDLAFLEDGSGILFAVYKQSGKNADKSGNNELEKAIWYFKQGMKGAVLKVKPDILGPDYFIAGRLQAKENSDWLIFNFQKKATVTVTEKDAVNVKIWSYRDKVILPDQIQIQNRNKGVSSYRAAINPITNQVIPIENDTDFLSDGPVGDYAIIKGQYFVDASWWKLDAAHPTILLSLKDNKRIILKSDNRSLTDFSFSPDRNWLIFYDKTNMNFFSYKLKTGKILNITKSIPTSFQKESDEGINLIGSPVSGVAAWISDDNSFILYDNYDIWKVDPSGTRKAINITNGYGKKNKLKLRLVYSNGVRLSDTLLIVGFSPENKQNGFLKKVLGKYGNPQKLFMGPYTFYRTESQKPSSSSFSNGIWPIKADSANIWVVSRETASESRNYFMTDDFKEFTSLTNYYPEREFNWLSTELVSWKQLDGTVSQGILYKPENFDSKRKYPLLITYYEKMSHRLYEFPKPRYSNGDIDIPWFVTHGYLVFTPDIHYTIASRSGKTTGDAAFNSIVSGAKLLSKRAYIDGTKMGIIGHSFGGAQTNFIITHTNLFAAACEFAGTTDAISAYLTLVPFSGAVEHLSKQNINESGQGRMGATLWERPDLYIKQSAVLRANKVTSPLLIVHNERDNQINYRQGIELYMALRRLGKKVWMLQYDDRHSLLEEKNAIDFTIRLTQFFDHYLKKQLPPEWMTKGIPLDLIGKKNGYELQNPVE